MDAAFRNNNLVGLGTEATDEQDTVYCHQGTNKSVLIVWMHAEEAELMVCREGLRLAIGCSCPSHCKSKDGRDRFRHRIASEGRLQFSADERMRLWRSGNSR